MKLPNYSNILYCFLMAEETLGKAKETLNDKGKALNMQYLALINQY